MKQFSANYPRLTASIGAVLFWIVFLALFMSVYLFLPFLPAHSPLKGLLHGITGTLLAFFVTWIFLRRGKRSFADIGLVFQRGTLARFVLGVLIGALIFGAILCVLLYAGNMELVKNTQGPGVLDLMAYFAYFPLALMEEVAFRAYPFISLNKAFGLRISQVFVALAFALYHLLNGWSLYVSFVGPFVWSFVFGLGAVWSGGIALPTGIHMALNVLQVLVGMKEGAGSVWKLTPPAGLSPDATARMGHLGAAVQLGVLAAAIAATEYFIKKKRSIHRSSQDGLHG